MMTNLREKFSYLRQKGGVKAALWWLYKKLTRSEPFYIFMKNLQPAKDFKHFHNAAKPRFLCLEHEADLANLDETLLNQISQQSGTSLSNIIKNSGAVYSLIKNGKPICQLNINFSQYVSVDTPCDLVFQLVDDRAFLGYLYTVTDQRSQGFANILLSLVQDRLYRKGYRELVAHVSCTNVPSIRAFRFAGWSRNGFFVANQQGDLIIQNGTGNIVAAKQQGL